MCAWSQRRLSKLSTSAPQLMRIEDTCSSNTSLKASAAACILAICRTQTMVAIHHRDAYCRIARRACRHVWPPLSTSPRSGPPASRSGQVWAPPGSWRGSRCMRGNRVMGCEVSKEWRVMPCTRLAEGRQAGMRRHATCAGRQQTRTCMPALPTPFTCTAVRAGS